MRSRSDLAQVWNEPDRFGRLFSDLWSSFIRDVHDIRDFQHPAGWPPIVRNQGAAITRVFAWLVTDWTDLLRLCDMAGPDGHPDQLLEFYAWSDLADTDVLREFIRNVPAERLSGMDHGWAEFTQLVPLP